MWLVQLSLRRDARDVPRVKAVGCHGLSRASLLVLVVVVL
jgi:hypothetical protein